MTRHAHTLLISCLIAVLVVPTRGGLVTEPPEKPKPIPHDTQVLKEHTYLMFVPDAIGDVYTPWEEPQFETLVIGPIGVAIAGVLINEAIKFFQAALQKQADRYQASFGDAMQIPNRSGVYLLVRTVEPKPNTSTLDGLLDIGTEIGADDFAKSVARVLEEDNKARTEPGYADAGKVHDAVRDQIGAIFGGKNAPQRVAFAAVGVLESTASRNKHAQVRLIACYRGAFKARMASNPKIKSGTAVTVALIGPQGDHRFERGHYEAAASFAAATPAEPNTWQRLTDKFTGRPVDAGLLVWPDSPTITLELRVIETSDMKKLLSKVAGALGSIKLTPGDLGIE